MNANQNVRQTVVELNPPNFVNNLTKRKVTRQFVGNESLGKILVSVFEFQVDKLVESIYDTTRAGTVASHTNQSKGAELS